MSPKFIYIHIIYIYIYIHIIYIYIYMIYIYIIYIISCIYIYIPYGIPWAFHVKSHMVVSQYQLPRWLTHSLTVTSHRSSSARAATLEAKMGTSTWLPSRFWNIGWGSPLGFLGIFVGIFGRKRAWVFFLRSPWARRKPDYCWLYCCVSPDVLLPQYSVFLFDH